MRRGRQQCRTECAGCDSKTTWKGFAGKTSVVADCRHAWTTLNTADQARHSSAGDENSPACAIKRQARPTIKKTKKKPQKNKAVLRATVLPPVLGPVISTGRSRAKLESDRKRAPPAQERLDGSVEQTSSTGWPAAF